jgi:hypothetical protein
MYTSIVTPVHLYTRIVTSACHKSTPAQPHLYTSSETYVQFTRPAKTVHQHSYSCTPAQLHLYFSPATSNIPSTPATPPHTTNICKAALLHQSTSPTTPVLLPSNIRAPAQRHLYTSPAAAVHHPTTPVHVLGHTSTLAQPHLHTNICAPAQLHMYTRQVTLVHADHPRQYISPATAVH